MRSGHVGIGKITLDRLNRKPCFFQQQLHFMAKVIGRLERVGIIGDQLTVFEQQRAQLVDGALCERV